MGSGVVAALTGLYAASFKDAGEAGDSKEYYTCPKNIETGELLYTTIFWTRSAQENLIRGIENKFTIVPVKIVEVTS